MQKYICVEYIRVLYVLCISAYKYIQYTYTFLHKYLCEML